MSQRLSYYSFYFKEFMLKSHYKFSMKIVRFLLITARGAC
jgi:hypothetical protein